MTAILSDWKNLNLLFYFKGTERDTTFKNAFNQAFTSEKVFVPYENMLEFR